MVRDSLNRLAFNEDDDEPIEVDPFTDVDDGLPIVVTYRKNPNKKKGENFYEVSFPKKVTARPLTDEEIEYFMTLKPIQEVVGRYGQKDFEKALEGLQNFDEDNEIGLFEEEDWLNHLEEIKAQYDSDEDEEEEKPKRKTKKSKKETRKAKKVVEEPEEEEEEEEEQPEETAEAEDDEFTDMDRSELKKYIAKNKLDIVVKKSMSDDDIRELIRAAASKEEEPEEEEEESEEEPEEEPARITLDDIRKKLKK